MNVAATRIRRTGLALAVSGMAAAAIPAGASASAGYGALLTPGGTVCVQQYAAYQVRGEGTATRMGARFTLRKNGVVIFRSATATTNGWAAEGRSSSGTFPGPGIYQVCVTNPNSTNTVVNIGVLSDAELP